MTGLFLNHSWKGIDYRELLSFCSCLGSSCCAACDCRISEGCTLPVCLDFLCQLCAVDLACEVLLHGSAAYRVVIVRIIVVVCNQLVIISIGLDGLSKRVADIQPASADPQIQSCR